MSATPKYATRESRLALDFHACLRDEMGAPENCRVSVLSEPAGVVPDVNGMSFRYICFVEGSPVVVPECFLGTQAEMQHVIERLSSPLRSDPFVSGAILAGMPCKPHLDAVRTAALVAALSGDAPHLGQVRSGMRGACCPGNGQLW